MYTVGFINKSTRPQLLGGRTSIIVSCHAPEPHALNTPPVTPGLFTLSPMYPYVLHSH